MCICPWWPQSRGIVSVLFVYPFWTYLRQCHDLSGHTSNNTPPPRILKSYLQHRPGILTESISTPTTYKYHHSVIRPHLIQMCWVCQDWSHKSHEHCDLINSGHLWSQEAIKWIHKKQREKSEGNRGKKWLFINSEWWVHGCLMFALYSYIWNTS